MRNRNFIVQKAAIVPFQILAKLVVPCKYMFTLKVNPG